MKVMTCPLNGPRNISEFTYGGEFKQMPDPQTCSDAEWADYVFNSEDTLTRADMDFYWHRLGPRKRTTFDRFGAGSGAADNALNSATPNIMTNSTERSLTLRLFSYRRRALAVRVLRA